MKLFSKKKIYIMQGGLGNQLFILKEAIKNNSNKKIYINNVSYLLKNRRKFKLNEIINILKLNISYYPLIFQIIDFFLIKISSKKLDNKFLSLPGDHEYIHDNNFLNRSIHTAYFQYLSLSCYESINKIKEKIKFKIKKNNFLAVHIRRGDYLLKKHNIHGLINEKDIVREIENVLKKFKFSKIIIFTDSPEKIDLKKMKFNIPVELDKSIDDIESFKLLSSSKAIICANSSFSLWAALLGNPVYFSVPEFWMKNIKTRSTGFSNLRIYKCTPL